METSVGKKSLDEYTTHVSFVGIPVHYLVIGILLKPSQENVMNFGSQRDIFFALVES